MQDLEPSACENPEAKSMQVSEPSACGNPEAKSMQDTESSSPNEIPEFKFINADDVHFDKALRELGDLRSQLYYAADYCETTFLKTKQKKMIVENTKEYICRAVVTVVDHLGTVSANLEDQFLKNNVASDTELRINCLKQRLLLCEQYSQKLALAKLRWSANSPRYHSCYIGHSIPNLDESNAILRDSDKFDATKSLYNYKLDTKGDLPIFLYPYTHKAPVARLSTSDVDVKTPKKNSNSGSLSGFELSNVLPVPAGLSILPKLRNPSFHSQGTHKLESNIMDKKATPKNNFLSLLKRNRRTI